MPHLPPRCAAPLPGRGGAAMGRAPGHLATVTVRPGWLRPRARQGRRPGPAGSAGAHLPGTRHPGCLPERYGRPAWEASGNRGRGAGTRRPFCTVRGAAAPAEAAKGGELWGGPWSDNPPPPPVPSSAERVPPHAGVHTAHPGGDATQTPACQPQPAAEAQLQ